MKISIALFTTLIAASHHLLASAADAAVDGATSRPHLRALTDAAVDVACPGENACNINSNNNQCDTGYECKRLRGSSDSNCGECVEIPCNMDGHCNEAGNGCPSGTICENGPNAFSTGDGCYGCRPDDSGLGGGGAAAPPQNDEDGSEATSLRASILEEE